MKKFPTKARTEARAAELAERKSQREDAQKAANQARKEAREKQQAKVKEREKKNQEAEERHKKPQDSSEDAAAKAKLKVEKLRKQLEKEEKRAAKAEAKASKKSLDANNKGTLKEAKYQIDGSKKRKRSASDIAESKMVEETCAANSTQPIAAIFANEDTSIMPNNAGLHETPILDTITLDSQEKPQEIVSMAADPLTPMSQPPVSGDKADSPPTTFDLSDAIPETSLVGDLNEEQVVSLAINDSKASQDSGTSILDSSSDISSTHSDDLTSSSGSSSFDADSEDDGPEQASSKRNGLEKVAPPKRNKKTGICREFLKSGRCKWGDGCKWRHELPERGSRTAAVKEIVKPEGKKERVGLYQRVSTRSQSSTRKRALANFILRQLVEQEKEKEDRDILNAIISLGEKGLLDPEAHTNRLEQ